ncbi:MAG: hypothetical protein Q8R12_03380 [bacterium]|nr:hypothetical protein [bacterium]
MIPGNSFHCSNPKCHQMVVYKCPTPYCGIFRKIGDERACSKCGAATRWQNGELVVILAGSSSAPAEIKPTVLRCNLCGEEITSDASRCPKCKSRTKSFERLCPFCGAEVELKDNDCKNCHQSFPLSVDKSLFYVVCGFCGKGSEVDDWMADRNLPFLFQTKPGVKLGCWPSLEDAAMVWMRYFHSKEPVLAFNKVMALLQKSDEAPWFFTSGKLALEYFSEFPCHICGQTCWKLSALRGLWKPMQRMVQAAQPHVAKGAKATGRGVVSWFRGARQEWSGLTKKQSEKKGV